MPAVLRRETFHTSRLLEYFSEKELTLQTGHEPERWPEVVLKELTDNSLDACEEAGTAPEIIITTDERSIVVEDNGPGGRHHLQAAESGARSGAFCGRFRGVGGYGGLLPLVALRGLL
jgi:hypothetical protein